MTQTQILEELQEDPTEWMTNKELAEATDTTPDTACRQTKKLYKYGFVQRRIAVGQYGNQYYLYSYDERGEDLI